MHLHLRLGGAFALPASMIPILHSRSFVSPFFIVFGRWSSATIIGSRLVSRSNLLA